MSDKLSVVLKFSLLDLKGKVVVLLIDFLEIFKSKDFTAVGDVYFKQISVVLKLTLLDLTGKVVVLLLDYLEIVSVYSKYFTLGW